MLATNFGAPGCRSLGSRVGRRGIQGLGSWRTMNKIRFPAVP